jgi:hypothetical protein
MKKYKILSMLTLVGLVACTRPTSSSSNPLTSEVVQQALTQPNRTMLTSMMSMVSTHYAASELTLDARVAFDQQATRVSDLSVIQDMSLLVDFDLLFKTNNIGQSNGQALLDLNLNTFALDMLELDQPIALSNQSISLLYDDDFLYADITNATQLIETITGESSSNIPGKFKVAIDPAIFDDMGIEPIPEEDVDAMVEELLPMFDMIPQITPTISGTSLIIRYEVTQEDLPEIITYMVLQGGDVSSLSPSEQLMLAEIIEMIMEQVTINTLVVEVSVSLLTFIVEGLLIDIDVDLALVEEYYDWIYDPTDPEADMYGYVLVYDMINQSISIDIDVLLSMTMYETENPIAILINKEEYELVVMS